MNSDYKAYNQRLREMDSEFRLKPQGDKLTLVTTDKILIKRDVPQETLGLFIESVLREEFPTKPVQAVQAQSASRTSVNLNGSTHCSSSDFMTGVLVGGLFL